MKNNTSKKKIVLLITLILSIYFIFSLNNNPFSIASSDIYHFISSTNELSKDVRNIQDPFFNDNTTDPHYGNYLSILSILKNVTNIENTSLFILFGFINFSFFLFSIYYFTNYFLKNKRIAYLSSLFIPLLWGASNPIFVGLVSITDLIYTASYPTLFAFSVMFITTPLFDKFLKNNIFDVKLYTLCIILGFLIIISHIVTGIIYLSIISILILTKIRSIDNRKKKMLIVTYPFVVILISLIWPIYSLFDVILKAKLVNTGNFELKTDFFFNISNWKNIAGPFFILGIPSLLKSRKVFFILLTTFLFFMSISYLFPVRISMLWRFLPIMIIILNIFFVKLIIEQKNNKIRFLILFAVLCLALMYLNDKANLVNNNTDYYKNYDEILPLQRDGIIISDPITSYHLSAINKNKVLSVPINHINPLNENSAYYRYELIYKLLITNEIGVVDIKNIYGNNLYIVVINKNLVGDGIAFTTNTKVQEPDVKGMKILNEINTNRFKVIYLR